MFHFRRINLNLMDFNFMMRGCQVKTIRCDINLVIILKVFLTFVRDLNLKKTSKRILPPKMLPVNAIYVSNCCHQPVTADAPVCHEMFV